MVIVLEAQAVERTQIQEVAARIQVMGLVAKTQDMDQVVEKILTTVQPLFQTMSKVMDIFQQNLHQNWLFNLLRQLKKNKV